MINSHDNFNNVRSRFAPSPTGFVHIGSLRTALFSFLFARHYGGANILRVEDTDQTRLVPGAVENLLKVMDDLGLGFDEGYYLNSQKQAEQRGSYGSYVQSERLAIYQEQARLLIEQSKAYYCFCSTERLDEVRKEQVALKKPPMYDRHCRTLSPEEVQAQLGQFKDANKQPVIRQAIPLEGKTVVQDLIYGDITFDNSVIDDQVLMKSDGFPTYHLAVVVDDHLMAITHVIRGEEWINSTPKHVLLYEAFNWEPTQFAHLPNILNPNKTKLSKRQGDVAVEDFLRKGYLKEALINFVALLGWNPKTEQEIFSMEELIAQFDLAKINRAGAVFDLDKLDWMNGMYIRAKSASELLVLLQPYFAGAGIDIAKYSPDYLEAIINLEKDRLKKLSDIGDRTGYFFHKPNYDPPLLVWRKSNAADTKRILNELGNFFTALQSNDFNLPNFKSQLEQFIADKGYDNGSVLWPLRVALTGLDKSPGPFDVASILALGLGKDEVISRVAEAADKL